jgi:hypothetical protein
VRIGLFGWPRLPAIADAADRACPTSGDGHMRRYYTMQKAREI